jgi:hypothetical protein
MTGEASGYTKTFQHCTFPSPRQPFVPLARLAAHYTAHLEAGKHCQPYYTLRNRWTLELCTGRSVFTVVLRSSATVPLFVPTL